MKKSINIFKKIVLITSILNFPIGLMMIIQAISNKTGEALITNSVAGAFIIFAGVSLIWAIQEVNTRAPIILWNGFSIGNSLHYWKRINYWNIIFKVNNRENKLKLRLIELEGYLKPSQVNLSNSFFH